MRSNRLIGLMLLSCAAMARGAATKPATGPAEDAAKLNGKIAVSEHRITLAGQELKYKATAGYLPAKDEAGKEKASFFYVSYEKVRGEGEDISRRPITYVFNGGPGAAAVWLHLGTAGPKRVVMEEDGKAPPPPYRTVENEHTWLGETDLVFIDPVNTGFSRPAQGEKGEQFFGVREDVASVGEFIRLYTSKYERWGSPKFLAGESYGTTRAAGLSQYLIDRYGIALNGIVFVSSVLNFATISASEGNDLPYVMFLPTYTASAWHHRKLSAELLDKPLEKAVKEAEEFAIDEYLVALSKGAALPENQRKSVAEKLAKYSGLPAAFVDRADLRVTPSEFRKQLLWDARQVIGRFDSRIVGYDAEATRNVPDFDPSLPQYLAAYSGAFNDYVRRELKFESELPYEVLSDRVQPWNWGRGNAGYVNVASELQAAMIRNPHMKVMFAQGYFDLATPHFASDYVVNRLDLSKDLRRNVVQKYYTGGHMMYHNRADLVKLHDDVKAFIRLALERKGNGPVAGSEDGR